MFSLAALAQALTLDCIQKVGVSNQGRDTDYPGSGCFRFSSFFPDKRQDSTSIRPQPFPFYILSNLLLFVIQSLDFIQSKLLTLSLNKPQISEWMYNFLTSLTADRQILPCLSQLLQLRPYLLFSGTLLLHIQEAPESNSAVRLAILTEIIRCSPRPLHKNSLK
jgi:hypothetical protein